MGNPSETGISNRPVHNQLRLRNSPRQEGRMTIRNPAVWMAALLGAAALFPVHSLEAQRSPTANYVPVTDAMLRDTDPGDWLMIHRTYDHHAYSPLDEINRNNVGKLKLAWMRAMDEGPQQLRPLVYDGVMYIAHPGSDHLQALDATTGDLLWDYTREAPVDLREYAQLGNRTRRLAIYGDNIVHLTADVHLAAIDARTGALNWESRLADYRDGITHTLGAMIIDGRVMSGRTCMPAGESARCFIAAHDAATGEEDWRFYTAAGADDPGGETWGSVPPARRVHVSRGGCRAATIRRSASSTAEPTQPDQLPTKFSFSLVVRQHHPPPTCRHRPLTWVRSESVSSRPTLVALRSSQSVSQARVRRVGRGDPRF